MCCVCLLAADGQHVFLHSVNARCLAREYGSLENSPHTITATIVAMESFSMTEVHVITSAWYSCVCVYSHKRFLYIVFFELFTTFYTSWQTCSHKCHLDVKVRCERDRVKVLVLSQPMADIIIQFLICLFTCL